MALLKELKGSFVGGQVSPELQNRTDLEKFNTWVKEAKNTKIKPEGGISNRAGTIFIGKVKEATFRLTINVNVSATIIINGQVYSGETSKSVDLSVGSDYTYEVSSAGYETQSGSGTITENTVKNVVLESSADTYDFEITNDQSATISISANGDTPTTGTGTVTINEQSGSLIEWSVTKEGYVTQSGSFILTEDKSLEITLDEVSTTAILTIVPMPNDSVVKINGVVQNGVELDIGDSYTYEVSKEGYLDYTGTGTITEDTTINVTLQSQTVNMQNILPATNNIDLLLTYNVTETGTYKLEIQAEAGGEITIRDGGVTYWNAKYGGYTKLNVPLTKGDVLKVKSIGGIIIENVSGIGSGTFSTGVGIWLNDECIVVSGGGASFFRYYNQAEDNFFVSGSGYYGGDIVYDGQKIFGINHNGTTSSPSTSDNTASADGDKITGYQFACYGGSGYVKTSLQTYVVERKRMGGRASVKIDFIG